MHQHRHISTKREAGSSDPPEKASVDINNDQLESSKVKKRQPPRQPPDYLIFTSESTSTPTAPMMSLMLERRNSFGAGWSVRDLRGVRGGHLDSTSCRQQPIDLHLQCLHPLIYAACKILHVPELAYDRLLEQFFSSFACCLLAFHILQSFLEPRPRTYSESRGGRFRAWRIIF